MTRQRVWSPRSEVEAALRRHQIRQQADKLAVAFERGEVNSPPYHRTETLPPRGQVVIPVEGYLAGNVQRLIREERAYENSLKAAGKTGDTETVLLDRATIFRERGLSFDTSLEPDFALETMLNQLVQKGLMTRGSVRRIAVIGPSLDFPDKRLGLDF